MSSRVLNNPEMSSGCLTGILLGSEAKLTGLAARYGISRQKRFDPFKNMYSFMNVQESFVFASGKIMQRCLPTAHVSYQVASVSRTSPPQPVLLTQCAATGSLLLETRRIGSVGVDGGRERAAGDPAAGLHGRGVWHKLIELVYSLFLGK